MLATIVSAYTTMSLITQSSCTGSEAFNVHGCEFNSHNKQVGLRRVSNSVPPYKWNTGQHSIHLSLMLLPFGHLIAESTDPTQIDKSSLTVTLIYICKYTSAAKIYMVTFLECSFVNDFHFVPMVKQQYNQ